MTWRVVADGEVSLEPRPEGPDSERAEAELRIRGVRAPSVVPGVVLEGAVGAGSEYILFTTDGTPFEDALNICLISEALMPVEVVRIGTMYATGSFSDLDALQPDGVRFRFMGGITWRLELLKKRERCFPFLSDPRGVSRQPWFSRRMRLHGKPLPDA